MTDSLVIASARRTPIGAFQGALSSVKATDLGATAAKAALADAGVAPSALDEVIFGWLHFPNWMTLGAGPEGALQWHFLAMWILIANGIGMGTFTLIIVLAVLVQAARGRRGFGWSAIRIFVGLNFLLTVLLIIPIMAFNLAGGSFWPVRIMLGFC